MSSFVISGVEWRKVKMLGKGSFGEAHLVKSVADGESAVCKLVHMASMSSKEKEEARNEVAVLSRLRHPNIVRYMGSFEKNGTLHILMEYCNAGDVEGLIKKQRGIPIGEETVGSLFLQMAQGVRYLHERRILHRDLKAQNVFLSQETPSSPLVAKIGDFGISTVLRNTLALAKTVCGTPYYFSPELCQNKPYNNKSDIWSLGCILYEMCTLKHAFDATSMKALMSRILKGTYVPVGRPYSPAVQALVAGMLQQRASKRLCIQQVLSSDFAADQMKRMNADHEQKIDKLIESKKASSSGVKKPVKVVTAQPRKDSANADDRISQARRRRAEQERQAIDRRLQREDQRRQRDQRQSDEYYQKMRHNREIPMERRLELERLDDIRARVEMASYEDQLPYVEQGWKVAQEVKLRQDARNKQYEERDRHLDELNAQMEAITNKMKQPRQAPPPAPVQSSLPPIGGGGGGGGFGGGRVSPPPSAPPQKEPSPAQLAQAYKNRVSEDAPWNRNRNIPVGFTKESWEQHRNIMNRFGQFGENPIDAAAAQPVVPPHTIRPDPVHGGMRSVNDLDVDRLLQKEERNLEAHDPRFVEAQRERDERKVQAEAEQEWQKHQQRIRAAQNLPTDPSLSEAELAWQQQKRKIDEARGVIPPQPSPPSQPPQHNHRYGNADDYSSDDEAMMAGAGVRYDEYDEVIEQMNKPSGLPEPPEMFEEEELPANDVTRVTNMAKFTLDGKTLQLRGLKPDDPLPLRVEGLRMYLTEVLGGPRLFQYLHDALEEIQTSDVDDDTANIMLASLEAEFGEKARYVDLMIQMMVCEGMMNEA